MFLEGRNQATWLHLCIVVLVRQAERIGATEMLRRRHVMEVLVVEKAFQPASLRVDRVSFLALASAFLRLLLHLDDGSLKGARIIRHTLVMLGLTHKHSSLLLSHPFSILQPFIYIVSYRLRLTYYRKSSLSPFLNLFYFLPNLQG